MRIEYRPLFRVEDLPKILRLIMLLTNKGRSEWISSELLLSSVWAIRFLYGGGVAGLVRCSEFPRCQILLGDVAKDIDCKLMMK